MEEIRFNWVSNELLTKTRMDLFTDFLHQRFGYLHMMNNGDYGFGLLGGQKIDIEQDDRNIKVSLPPMQIVFPDGFLIAIPEQFDLAIDLNSGLLCLKFSSNRALSLIYCINEKEAYDSNYLPLINTSKPFYLKPVLNMFYANEYDATRKSLEQSLNTCLELIDNYFLNNSDLDSSYVETLRSTIFQSYLSVIQKIKFESISNKHFGSYAYFNLYKNLLLLTDYYKNYFDKIDALRGLNNKYSNRDSSFIDKLSNLTNNINFLHTSDNIIILDIWLKELCNTVKVYAEPNKPNTNNNFEANKIKPIINQDSNDNEVKQTEPIPPSSKKLV